MPMEAGELAIFSGGIDVDDELARHGRGVDADTELVAPPLPFTCSPDTVEVWMWTTSSPTMAKVRTRT